MAAFGGKRMKEICESIIIECEGQVRRDEIK